MTTSLFERQNDSGVKTRQEREKMLMSSGLVEDYFTISDAARAMKVHHSIARGVVTSLANQGKLEAAVMRQTRLITKYRRAGTATRWLSMPWRKQ